ncbi:peptidylprolyl isomerase [Pseudidiomarina aestuarii]|uniref:Peptidyl-prolyl cis-trans isomerase n=1 Tax=Pseudidiomarina aestuarii TaxID=624146 RepID=A0A7Z6ZTY3_9GAMM|nr:peptidylprolyl isomerase [Pseudidiomarina aestuarii]RUO41354.1 peptidylprolyl isomerase [Pseudidiomarina aestuarii]
MRYVVKLAAILAGLMLMSPATSANGIQPDNPFPRLRFVTSLGNLEIELDRYKAPLTAENFLDYVKAGSYNNTIFHRLVPGFVLQGGGYDENFEAKTIFKKIPNESGNGLKNVYGTIAMARESDPHTATRQFFFNLNDNTSLDPSSKGWGYAVFGWIVSGEETLEKLAALESVPFDEKTLWRDVPKDPPVLIRIEVVPQS